jgi:N-acetylglutamate synthase-like GNAT family acetyltransferase
MQPIHCPMTWEEFRDFPRLLGWKHEYYGGELHVTPAHLVVTLILPLTPRDVPDELTIQPVCEGDEQRLIPGFLEAFDGTMDYAGASADDLQKAAHRYFKGYFGNVRGEPMPASCFAEENGEVLGAALIKKIARGPLLDCLFVAPHHQHGGIATTLVGHAVNRLLELNEEKLFSYCMLGNAASLEWHSQFGFEELPDFLVANHRANILRDELARHRRLNDLLAEELSHLTLEADHWAKERERLHDIADRDYAAVHPVLEE